MKEPKKTFILGLGAQKCGTTWLYRLLQESENFSPGLIKEFNIWNVIDNDLFKSKNIILPKSKRQFLRWRMLVSKNYYFDYFASLLSKDKNITADITPTYVCLSKKRLQFIKDKFNKKNIHVKIVLLVRDPISRIKSATNFMINKNKKNSGIKNYNQSFSKILSEYYKSPHCAIRTDYVAAIKNAKAVFKEEDIFIGIYEKLFSINSVRNLSEFLGIKVNTNFGKKIIHKTESKKDITEHDEDIKIFYRNVYKHFNKNYPDTLEFWS